MWLPSAADPFTEDPVDAAALWPASLDFRAASAELGEDSWQ